jgi:hypothetical protein
MLPVFSQNRLLLLTFLQTLLLPGFQTLLETGGVTLFLSGFETLLETLLFGVTLKIEQFILVYLNFWQTVVLLWFAAGQQRFIGRGKDGHSEVARSPPLPWQSIDALSMTFFRRFLFRCRFVRLW